MQSEVVVEICHWWGINNLLRQICISFLPCEDYSYSCQNMMLLRGGVVFQQRIMRLRKHAPYTNTTNRWKSRLIKFGGVVSYFQKVLRQKCFELGGLKLLPEYFIKLNLIFLQSWNSANQFKTSSKSHLHDFLKFALLQVSVSIGKSPY